jgi:hypothetical protein
MAPPQAPIALSLLEASLVALAAERKGDVTPAELAGECRDRTLPAAIADLPHMRPAAKRPVR